LSGLDFILRKKSIGLESSIEFGEFQYVKMLVIFLRQEHKINKKDIPLFNKFKP